jgi:hypothetical protein
MESKTQRRARLKEMRKKYHLGEFKNYSKKSLKGGVHMARRHKIRHHRRYGGSSGKGIKGIALGAVAYGAIRQYASNALLPVTSKIPLGTLSDEAVLGVASYLLYKKTKGLPSEIGKAGLYIEMARIGEALISGQVIPFGNTSVSSGGTVASLY